MFSETNVERNKRWTIEGSFLPLIETSFIPQTLIRNNNKETYVCNDPLTENNQAKRLYNFKFKSFLLSV